MKNKNIDNEGRYSMGSDERTMKNFTQKRGQKKLRSEKSCWGKCSLNLKRIIKGCRKRPEK